LLDVLNKLVDLGNTVLIIEHHLDVIKQADWLIDLGPEGGVEGGRIVAQGTPEQIAKAKKSYTGQALARLFSGRSRLRSAAADSVTNSTFSDAETRAEASEKGDRPTAA
jgi:excinuclease ABC subunit A